MAHPVNEPFDLQEGPQRIAAESEAQVIFYGGAKGGGKSRWLVHEACKWFDIPGRSCLMFRRTYPELKDEGSLWDEGKKIWPLLGGEMVESRLKCTFPSGASIALRHMQHEKDAEKYNGKNIGDVCLDELTFFTERQFWILLSCMRSTAEGDAPKLRATMNPDPDSWVLQFVDWYIDEAGYAIPERSGVVRWFGRIDGTLVWFASKAEAIAGGVDMPMSFTFIGAKLWDNPALLALRPEYLANLKAMPPVDQARFLGGNWRIRRQAGDYFQEAWFPKRDADLISQKAKHHPTDEDVLRWFRIWDFASSPHKGDTIDPDALAPDDNDPDWTMGGLFGQCRDGRLLLKHLAMCRDTPGAVEEFVIQNARMDGRGVIVILPHDPAQAGDYQVETMTKTIRRRAKIRRIENVRATKAKEEYALVAGRFCYQGKVLVQLGAWNKEFFRQLEAFPNGKATKTDSQGRRQKTVHDDAVDVVAQAVMWHLENPIAPHMPVDGSGRLPLYPETDNDVRLRPGPEVI